MQPTLAGTSTCSRPSKRKRNPPSAGESLEKDVHKSLEDESEQVMLPVEALFYALPYMSLRELLSMEQVCKASRKWVREGVSLWRTLYVRSPLNFRLTDKILIQLSKRSHGELECLCLVNCNGITDLAVEQIVMASPRLKELFLPGCTGLTADGIVSMVRAHTSKRGPGMPGIKELKVEDISGLTEHHVQSLRDILDMPKASLSHYKPRIYLTGGSVLSDHHQRPIDVDACPKCREMRMVYDCGRDTCQEKQECRACVDCTARCHECGVCLKDGEHADTILCFKPFVCSDCRLLCSRCNEPVCGNQYLNFYADLRMIVLCMVCANMKPFWF